MGAGGNDILKGWLGDDVLIGGPGDDRLFGDKRGLEDYYRPGTDTLIGGPGRDFIWAVDHHRDRRISCGTGAGPPESAITDTLDPVALGC